METYIVNVREVHIQPVEVEASSEEEAIQEVKDGEGEYMDDLLKYSHTLNSDTWTVEKQGDNK